MVNRFRIICAVVCTIATNLALVSAATSSTDSTDLLGPADVVAIAIANNPSLAAMQARFEAMSAIPSQVGTLPDPILSMNALSFPTDSFNVGQEAMTQMQFGISQQLPFPGKLALGERRILTLTRTVNSADFEVREIVLLCEPDTRLGNLNFASNYRQSRT